jgi:predicted RNA-binding Zn ribbon-like protein
MVTALDEAPGELELVRALVNTLDVESGADSLSPAWFREHELSARGRRGVPPARAVAVREAFRALLLANNGEPCGPEPAEVLESAARRARLELRFGVDGSSRLEPAAAGVDAALGKLVAVAAAAMADGTWPRLKACAASDCRWAFYDHARNGSRTWCAMEVCGNRAKARRHRARRATGV